MPTWFPSAALAAVLLSACASQPAAPESYVVKPGDTLYGIAWRHNLDYRDLARWNQLGADFRITVGQRLALAPTRGGAVTPAPAAALGPAATVHSPNPNPRPKEGLRQLPGNGRPAVPDATKAEALALSAHLVWVWPTDRGTPRAVQSGGILLAGTGGQVIRAAAAGRVVYTGSGIRGYGQLLIIKHSELLLSAYAYNQDILVSEGAEVTAGQPVAHMGLGPKQSPVLYFEIRLNGKPIDPLPLLPKS
jgi:lipoprotein NlpD